MSLPSPRSTIADKTTKPEKEKDFRVNIGEINLGLPRVGQLQPLHAFNLDIATRRSARDVARDRLHFTAFPRVISTCGLSGKEIVDDEMIESARRACSARGYSTRHSQSDTQKLKGSENELERAMEASGASTAYRTRAEAQQAELRRELTNVGGGGGFNLSLLSSSRYYHGAASTCSGVSEVSKSSPRNKARAQIVQTSQLPYGREAFDGISDTADSLYMADLCRRYKMNDDKRYTSSIEVLKDGNRHGKLSKESAARGQGETIPQPKFMSQTPRGKATMLEAMTHRPKREMAAIAGGYF